MYSASSNRPQSCWKVQMYRLCFEPFQKGSAVYESTNYVWNYFKRVISILREQIMFRPFQKCYQNNLFDIVSSSILAYHTFHMKQVLWKQFHFPWHFLQNLPVTNRQTLLSTFIFHGFEFWTRVVLTQPCLIRDVGLVRWRIIGRTEGQGEVTH